MIVWNVELLVRDDARPRDPDGYVTLTTAQCGVGMPRDVAIARAAVWAASLGWGEVVRVFVWSGFERDRPEVSE